MRKKLKYILELDFDKPIPYYLDIVDQFSRQTTRLSLKEVKLTRYGYYLVYEEKGDDSE